MGMIPDPPPPPARAVPPPAFGNPSPQRMPDPFARPGKKPARVGEPSDGLVLAWRRTRRGLWWVGLALFLFLLAPLSVTGIGIAEKFGVQLPSQSPGYLKIDFFSTDAEIKLGAVVIPVVLGLLVLLMGRFGVANAPRSSYAKGLATGSALMELTNFDEIRDLRGLNMSDKHVHALGKVVEHAMALPAEQQQTAAAPDFESPQETILIALATAVIRSYCLEYEMAYGLVATKKSIRDLIRHRTAGNSRKIEDIELLCGWRAQTVGALLDELLAGKRTVRVEPVGRDLLLHVHKLNGNV